MSKNSNNYRFLWLPPLMWLYSRVTHFAQWFFYCSKHVFMLSSEIVKHLPSHMMFHVLSMLKYYSFHFYFIFGKRKITGDIWWYGGWQISGTWSIARISHETMSRHIVMVKLPIAILMRCKLFATNCIPKIPQNFNAE